MIRLKAEGIEPELDTPMQRIVFEGFESSILKKLSSRAERTGVPSDRSSSMGWGSGVEGPAVSVSEPITFAVPEDLARVPHPSSAGVGTEDSGVPRPSSARVGIDDADPKLKEHHRVPHPSSAGVGTEDSGVPRPSSARAGIDDADPKLKEHHRVPHPSSAGVGTEDSGVPRPSSARAGIDDADPKLKEHCGVAAVYHHPDAARQVYLSLYALQHRGQESAGIASADGHSISNIKGMGLVSEIFTDEVLSKLKGNMAIGHTRYSTTGDSALLNAQPIRVESTKGLIAIAHNGNLVNLGNLRVQLERQGAVFQTTSDSEIIIQLIAHSTATTLVDAIADSLRQVEGAFSIVMMTRDRIFAARDRHGFRPLSMGRIQNPDGPDTIVFASETCAFDLLHAKFERDVAPGELVMVTEDGVTSRQYAEPNQSSCIFEHVYFARPDSKIFNRWVQDSREQMGRQLARESGVPADLVVPVPDSGVTAAIGYAAESGIPFRFGLIRNHYVGRTFIEPEQKVRDFGVRLKLNPVRNLLEGKRIILIDDSIIRGTTSRKIVRMVRGAGAKEVHLRISCPPTISPCFYGVDTPRKSELIAANQSIEEIRQFIEADSLAYLSLDGLQHACDGGEGNHYCVACYTGEYPTAWVDVEDILPATATF